MMSWRSKVAMTMPGSKVFHVSWSVDGRPETHYALCNFYLSSYRGGKYMSIREARALGLRLCKRCEARGDEILARLLDVDAAIEDE